MLLVVQVFQILNIFAYDFDSASVGSEFESIRLQVEKHLLDPLHITADHKFILVVTSEAFWKSLADCNKFDAHILSLFLLDHLYFLDGFLDTKAAYIFSELT